MLKHVMDKELTQKVYQMIQHMEDKMNARDGQAAAARASKNKQVKPRGGEEQGALGHQVHPQPRPHVVAAEGGAGHPVLPAAHLAVVRALARTATSSVTHHLVLLLFLAALVEFAVELRELLARFGYFLLTDAACGFF